MRLRRSAARMALLKLSRPPSGRWKVRRCNGCWRRFRTRMAALFAELALASTLSTTAPCCSSSRWPHVLKCGGGRQQRWDRRKSGGVHVGIRTKCCRAGMAHAPVPPRHAWKPVPGQFTSTIAPCLRRVLARSRERLHRQFR
ncbi:hypothetical protein H310_02730 [Aphanomyces invadans]|uniref:Uncharacterized protein n=1 Tax=Aphanomyces invadans TaxID=157072 RepID=A0A024UKW1_9STRA|nr:hypothetical protein H310_02730 [Aphanomyces invadans]ETW06482.1 hypothetical protein H310_02730 [Aphanomyces invadans]|eukprot:XP_008864557.1 hypothetical protein H310_02730 [Aphanomyces invadans]